MTKSQEQTLTFKKLGKKVSNVKRHLNNEFVGKMTPALLSEIDANDEVRTWLKAIGEALQDSNR